MSAQGGLCVMWARRISSSRDATDDLVRSETGGMPSWWTVMRLTPFMGLIRLMIGGLLVHSRRGITSLGSSAAAGLTGSGVGGRAWGGLSIWDLLMGDHFCWRWHPARSSAPRS